MNLSSSGARLFSFPQGFASKNLPLPGQYKAGNGDTKPQPSISLEDFSATIKQEFITQELAVSFLCVDSKGEHETGEARVWRNRITLKSVCYQNGSDKMVELRSAPTAPIRYTTDGSDPKNARGSYAEPFVVLPGTVCVLAIAEKDGLASDVHCRDIRWEPAGKTMVEIKPEEPAVWKCPHHPSTTKDAYEFMGRLKKLGLTYLPPKSPKSGGL